MSLLLYSIFSAPDKSTPAPILNFLLSSSKSALYWILTEVFNAVDNSTMLAAICFLSWPCSILDTASKSNILSALNASLVPDLPVLADNADMKLPWPPIISADSFSDCLAISIILPLEFFNDIRVNASPSASCVNVLAADIEAFDLLREYSGKADTASEPWLSKDSAYTTLAVWTVCSPDVGSRPKIVYRGVLSASPIVIKCIPLYLPSKSLLVWDVNSWPLILSMSKPIWDNVALFTNITFWPLDIISLCISAASPPIIWNKVSVPSLAEVLRASLDIGVCISLNILDRLDADCCNLASAVDIFLVSPDCLASSSVIWFNNISLVSLSFIGKRFTPCSVNAPDLLVLIRLTGIDFIPSILPSVVIFNIPELKSNLPSILLATSILFVSASNNALTTLLCSSNDSPNTSDIFLPELS